MPSAHLSRRRFLALSAVGFTAAVSSSRSVFAQKEPSLTWHNVQDWGIEGKGWNDTAKYFDRFPARAEGKVPGPVWSLSRHSAGMLVRFKTDATSIWTEHTVTNDVKPGANLTAIAQSGLDLYATDPAGDWKWLSVTRPGKKEMKDNIINGLAAGERSYQIYLPLYNGTESLKIGIPEGASFSPIEPRKEKPILFYGTSITHGASASRPGMPHPAILGRWLNRPVINLGFSGNGRMESSVGEFLIEQDPAVYVIDCLPNMTGDQVEERAAPLIRQLRTARPDTPILLVEDRTYANTPFIPAKQKRHEESRAALRKAYETTRQAGVTKVWYLEGEKLLGADREDTIDSSHPSDLGFWRQAEAFAPVLKEALAASPAAGSN